MRYLADVVTLKYDAGLCVGCGMCASVCPHRVFGMSGKKAALIDRDACIECGACAKNCPASAIEVKVGVGCASGIIKGWLTGTEPSCGCGDDCC